MASVYPQSGGGALPPIPQPAQSQPVTGQPVAGQPVAGQPMPGGGQPSPAGWGSWPSGASGPVYCPPGLQYLASVDQLLVKQKMEAFEAFTGFETNNKYQVLNSMGQRVYMAVEDTCCCTQLIHLERPLRCSCCLCFCCLQKMEVQAPPGTVIGYVRQAWSLCCIPRYKIQDAKDEIVLRIEGPCCRCNICGDIEFDVTSKDGDTHVGTISKQWSGLAKEIFTDADNFGVTFPLDMDVKTKATTLGAVFLIDFMYFEGDPDDVKDEMKKLRD
ncbi:hypothetical protein ACOMHN_040349 [Nucella lapillus]